MAPEKFKETVRAELDDLINANVLVNHVTEDGRQVALLRGTPHDERRAFFVAVTAPNTDPKDQRCNVERFPTGSLHVRHPSYDSTRGGRQSWSVQTPEGQVVFPPERNSEVPIRLGAAALYPAPSTSSRTKRRARKVS